MSAAVRALRCLAGALLLAACSGDDAPAPPDTSPLLDLSLKQLEPAVLLPATRLVLGGGPFIPDFVGASRLRFRGTFGGSEASFAMAARFVDYDIMEADWPGAGALGLAAAEGTFAGQVTVEADSRVDGRLHLSPPLDVVLELRETLTPRLDALDGAVAFVNDLVTVRGDGLLLGGAEGTTFAVVQGCFTPEGASSCDPVGPTEATVRPAAPGSRGEGVFAFSPRIAGIRPGTFTGSVMLSNHHGSRDGAVVDGGEELELGGALSVPVVSAISPETAGLGQYVGMVGSGFVGAEPEGDPTLAATVIELSGTFTPAGSSEGRSTAVSVVPEFVSGQLVRYVLNEEDALGTLTDLRRAAGTFVGTARPVIQYGEDTVLGRESQVSLGLARVKQVVWLKYLPTYVESLRHFGLRRVDDRIRRRVLEVARRDYAGIHIEFRSERPEDHALFSEVELSGPDPNGAGFLGYDNTPGKDVGNLRLYDRIGGVNALTQVDGYPGYGGIFVESIFSFSEHPGEFARKSELARPEFDALFDPFRPDRGGTPVAESDLDAGVPELTSGAGCPGAAGGRPVQIGCAVFALGSIIGTTMTHEIAHSLGLADPEGTQFHNPGDAEDRLMDGGSARPFEERAELRGRGPGRFCREDYAYLRSILPDGDGEPLVTRPACGEGP